VKIFREQDLKDEVENKTIDLGIVDVGDSKEFEYWILNDTKDELKFLKYVLKKIDRETGIVTNEISEEAMVEEAPTEMLPHDSSLLIIRYTPEISIDQGLRVQLHITGKRIVD
jgi:hypothetical protein